MNTQHSDFQKILQLIATNEIENITLAIQIAPSIGVDIIAAIIPFLDKDYHNKKRSIEAQVCDFLQKDRITIIAHTDSRFYDGLVFCQNADIVDIALANFPLSTHFEYFKYYKFTQLFISSGSVFPLNTPAIENLTQYGKLEALSISEPTNYTPKQIKDFVVPPELGNIHSLCNLYLKHQLLKKIPDSFLNLTNLNRISVYGAADLSLPDQLFNLPNLSFVDLNAIPDNVLPYISRKVRFSTSKPSFWTYFKLAAWKKNPNSYYDPSFEHLTVSLFYLILQILQFPFYLFASDVKSKMGFNFRAGILGFLLLLFTPLGLILLFLKYWGSLPDLYLLHIKVHNRRSLVYRLAQKATPPPSSIEGLGPMGCLGGIFLLVIFFFTDAFVPLLCRYLFLPLAIVLTPVDWLVAAIGKLLGRN